MNNNPIYIIDGQNFSTLEGFYDEISQVLLSARDWGRNLDAFDDILYSDDFLEKDFTIRWINSDLSRKRLSYFETVRQLKKRLEKCHPTNKHRVNSELSLALKGEGHTVFDWLIKVIRGHQIKANDNSKNIILVLE